SKRLGVLIRAVFPVRPERNPEVAQPFFVGVAVLHDQGLHSLRVFYRVNGTIASLLNLKIGAVVRSAPKEENKPHRSCCRYANELNRRSIASRRQFCSRAHPLPRPTLFDFLFPPIQASIRPSRWR